MNERKRKAIISFLSALGGLEICSKYNWTPRRLDASDDVLNFENLTIARVTDQFGSFAAVLKASL